MLAQKTIWGRGQLIIPNSSLLTTKVLGRLPNNAYVCKDDGPFLLHCLWVGDALK